MNNLIQSDWFAERAKLNFQTFIIEGITCEIMALDDDLISQVKSCKSSEAMINIAADNGISSNRSRIAEDEELSLDITAWWLHTKKTANCDPSVKYLIAVKVCDISGIADTLQDMLELEEEVAIETAAAIEKAKEEAKMIKVGDHNIPGSTDMNNLTAESLEKDAADYVPTI